MPDVYIILKNLSALLEGVAGIVARPRLERLLVVGGHTSRKITVRSKVNDYAQYVVTIHVIVM